MAGVCWQVVNAFHKIKDKEMKMKVMTRLQNITYLHTLLEKALASGYRVHCIGFHSRPEWILK